MFEPISMKSFENKPKSWNSRGVPYFKDPFLILRSVWSFLKFKVYWSSGWGIPRGYPPGVRPAVPLGGTLWGTPRGPPGTPRNPPPGYALGDPLGDPPGYTPGYASGIVPSAARLGKACMAALHRKHEKSQRISKSNGLEKIWQGDCHI